jgi:inner membrane protein
LASIVTHGLVGLFGGRLATARRMPVRFWLGLAALSILPDLDSVGFYLGVRYGDFLGHRGFFHSPFFAVIASTLAVLLLFRRPDGRVWLAFCLVTASHGFLDAMTRGGFGVALLSPFDPTRYFLPFRPLVVSPIGIRPFFGEWGLRVLASEFVYVMAPMAAILLVVEVARRRGAPQD